VLRWRSFVTPLVLGPRTRYPSRGPCSRRTPRPNDATFHLLGGLPKSEALRLSIDITDNVGDDNRPLFGNATMDTLRRDYRLLSAIYCVLAVTILFMPDRTLTKRLASKVGGASGFGLATGVSYWLAKATPVDHDDDDDDDGTLQRLNVGLLGFSSLGLLAVPGEAAFLPTPGLAMLLSGFMSAARLFGIMVAYRGWIRGISTTGAISLRSPRKAIRDLLQGAHATLQGMRISKDTKKRSMTYRNSLLLVLASMGSYFMEGLFCIRVSTVPLKRCLVGKADTNACSSTFSTV
jgi:hypothetical protein